MKIEGFTAGPFQANTYVVINGDRALVIDPGMSAYGPTMEIVEREGVTLEAVVLTHGHIDHVRDAAEFELPTYIHPDDEVMFDFSSKPMQEFAQIFAPAIPMMGLDTFKKPGDLRHVNDGETLEVAGLSFTVIHAPGHSPGCVIFKSNSELVAFTGDVIFAGSVGRTDVPLCSPEAMQRSLAGPVWDLADELTLLSGHGPATTMERERATNPYLREAKQASAH
ncbi:MBL fold metallo-hydrolase [Corynebacterium aquatimens]|uniref:Glyoxylase-like metal-dependent hydrolase (Beta-lactamase superfamily II) n=1 Tax=Corynebacterium aquatimens TaxID=1190508 RepID=A0A931DX41_9CORY|nr:MBL fold metallo-hydrolase [Corynebacterium aquatimens]MBG6121715.1 glyoxylase-like metal-dependent hydrolase (beta-lactamase superfamily II) [Corynebacterium aquatimens]